MRLDMKNGPGFPGAIIVRLNGLDLLCHHRSVITIAIVGVGVSLVVVLASLVSPTSL